MTSTSHLERALADDIDTLMNWFTTESDVKRWGGPEFRFPFSPESFHEDCRWPEMHSFSLRSGDGDLAAFGQLYERDGRIHLARLAVKPGCRGQGIGKALVSQLMEAGKALLSHSSFSLFVYRDNEPALRCYRSLGFEVRPYPPGQQLADVCYFMTRPAGSHSGTIDNEEKSYEY